MVEIRHLEVSRILRKQILSGEKKLFELSHKQEMEREKKKKCERKQTMIIKTLFYKGLYKYIDNKDMWRKKQMKKKTKLKN